MPNAATLPLLLKQLGLSSMYAHWETEASEAEKGHWSYAQYLTALSDKEVASRQQKRVERHIREAKLPPGKTIDAFDFSSTKSVNTAQIAAIAENSTWVNQSQNVILFGASGVGKTHLAAAIGYRLIEQGIRALFMQTTTLVQKLQQARSEYKLAEAMMKLGRYPLLILDDIGYVKKTEGETSVLFELIANRYETNSLLITSNQPFSEWDQIFPDNVMTVAAVDRLVHHAIIIQIEEESYRKKSSMK